MDRRAVWAIVLMMAIALAPALLLKQGRQALGRAKGDSTVATPAVPAPAEQAQPAAPAVPVTDTTRTVAGDTVLVTSPLYTYGISTRGARLVLATLNRYPSMAAATRRRPVELIRPGTGLLGATLVRGSDSLKLADLTFSPSASKLDVNGPTQLRLTGSRGDVSVELTYQFSPDDYRIGVSGRVSGVGPNGGLLLLEVGPGLANTEADTNENHRALAIVTKQGDAERTDFASLKPGEPKTLSGPFEWVAVKSKYFVTALLAFDSAGGGISGVTAAAPATAPKHPTAADVRVSVPVGPSGAFGFSLYAGPMEYDQLRHIGHDFDDVNPYGWPGFRTLIRFFTVPIRWLLVFMHQQLGLAYGIALVIFGVLVRLLLWPLNQKAMRSSMQMQAIQPYMKELQDRYKDDPTKLQTEMMRLYKEQSVWRLLADAAAHADPAGSLFRLPEHDRASRRLVSLVAGPVAPGSALHHPAPHGAHNVRREQGGPGRDGTNPADAKHAVHHADHDDGSLHQLRIRAESLLRSAKSHEHPTAMDACQGTAQAPTPAGSAARQRE
jgi:YidC/Oxa1 family membrane protein insertase